MILSSRMNEKYTYKVSDVAQNVFQDRISDEAEVARFVGLFKLNGPRENL